MDFPALPGSLAKVRETVARHQAVGGWTHPVRIVAVTKTHGPEAVRAALAAGLADIGENRVQEAIQKQVDAFLRIRGRATLHGTKLLAAHLGLIEPHLTSPLPRMSSEEAKRYLDACLAAGFPTAVASGRV